MHDFRIRCGCRKEFVLKGTVDSGEPRFCPLCGSGDAVIIRCGPDAAVFELVQGVFGPDVREIRHPWEVPHRSVSYPPVVAEDGLVYGDFWERIGESLWINW